MLCHILAYIIVIFAINYKKQEIMAKTLFKRYIWLVDTIYRANGITFKEINERWLRNSMSGGEDLPLKTFNNHRVAIEDIFDINIVCNKKNGYKYYIENAEDMKKGGVRSWLLNTFAVNNLINESHHLKHRILFEQIPSGQKHLSTIIEAMQDGRTLEMTYKSFWKQDRYTIEVEPYFVKIFRQRWYMGAKHIKNDALRIYALDRVVEIQETDKTFIFPKDFNPDEYFYNCYGIIRDDNCPPEIILLKVLGTQREYLRSLPLHHSQEEIETGDDYSVFRYYLSPTYDFVQEIMSQGSKVEVLLPEHLKNEIRADAEIIANRH